MKDNEIFCTFYALLLPPSFNQITTQFNEKFIYV